MNHDLKYAPERRVDICLRVLEGLVEFSVEGASNPTYGDSHGNPE